MITQFSPSDPIISRILLTTFSVLLFTLFAFNTLLPSDDPYRCQPLLGSNGRYGSWINTPNENGSRAPFTNWQPEGCMLHHYTPDDIKQCMGDRPLLFSGDSTVRQVYWAMARLLDRKMAVELRENTDLPSNYIFNLNGVELRSIWNPYLETSAFASQLEVFSKKKHGLHEERLQHWNQENHGLYSETHDEVPGLVLLGAGAWFALRQFNHVSYPSFKSALDNITQILHLENLPDFGTAPMDAQGIGDEVFIAPAKPPDYDLLPKWRKAAKGYQRGELEALNEYLYSQEDKHHLRLLRSFPALSYQQPETMVDITETGMHVIDSVAEMKANILLNLRCNAKLDRKIGHPFTRTCCTDYGQRSWAHSIMLWSTFVYMTFWTVMQLLNISIPTTTKRWMQPSTTVATFAVALLYCYLADRTQILAKGNKEFTPQEVRILACICLIIALVTVRKTKPHIAPCFPLLSNSNLAEDTNILSKDQIDEWKGWMLFTLLIYHWTGAPLNSPVEILNRLLISIYVFQSSYSYTVYFLVEKDFSFRYIAVTLLRLNLLSCTLSYTMGTNYMFYFLPAFISFWFLITYATLAPYRRLNDRSEIVIGKITASFIIVTVILNFTPVCRGLFKLQQLVFSGKWDHDAFISQAVADGVVPFIGMFAGVIRQHVRHSSTWYTDYRNAIIPSMAGLLGYSYFYARLEDRSAFTSLYPSVSIIPIMSIIALRNATTTLRNYNSAAAVWLGRYSLELYAFHFHILLAGDGSGLLLLDNFTRNNGLFMGRWRDLVILLLTYLYISYAVAEATDGCTGLLTDANTKQFSTIQSILKHLSINLCL
ncbi:o-acetyltransferase CAS1 [Fusarium subglutinans]|uniref:O-acetyltransferase CAS1 n=1 Tax=Gibberella subglutinans TaxID=42677 RepID=A0A8H5V7H4_GIBSU|nr:o-acetyltransferase CAS1 [Fusarium subglutinans]KAF5611645.1 o-acetyltransferase CAS1 [Fusarium subglutinans]